jgi:hypothetical protein
MPSSAARCPHCARPSLFPNVEAAAEAAEVAALDGRYNSAITLAIANGTAAIAEVLEREATARSRAVISRDSSEVYRLACGDDQLYTTYHKQKDAGSRVPTGSEWDEIRPSVDARVFPDYDEEVRFGALMLDETGLVHYGDCHLILKTNMVDFRTTAFTENTAAFVQKNKFMIPAGHRATWPQRGRLAVAKLVPGLTQSSTAADLPTMLKSDGPTSDDDSFLETHVYGSMSIRTVEQVTISRGAKHAVRLPALREKLKKFGVRFVVV